MTGARKSGLEETFAWWIGTTDIPPPEREYVFAPPRKWRFDFAWPAERLAVEIEGLTRQGGRHQRMAGFERDAEKYEAALLAGWRVYRVPGGWVARGSRLILRPEVVHVIRAVLTESRSGPTSLQDLILRASLPRRDSST